MATPVLVFDIETIPDVAGIRKLHRLGPELPDGDVATMAVAAWRIPARPDASGTWV